MACWTLCIVTFCTLVECVSDIDDEYIHLSLQDGWAALMMASQNGQVECVKMLLDQGAEINMQKQVSGVIIHCVYAMHHVPRVHSSE